MADNETLNDGVEELALDPEQLAGAGEQDEQETMLIDEKVETAVRNVAEEAKEDFAEQAALVEESVAAEESAPAEQPAPAKRERRSKQARAEKEAQAAADQVEPAKAATSKATMLGLPAWIAISVACLVLGLVLGRFVLGGSAAGSSSLAGKTTVSDNELDTVCATYTYNGKSNTITVRDVIEQNGTLDAAKQEDGTYAIPSAEYAINAARTAILNAEVESRGIEVSEEDAAAYAETALGTSDFDAIASTYGMDADAVKELVMENCRLNTLREEVIGGTLPEAPTAPTTAEEGKEDEVTKEYADYIIELAGDAWSKKKGEWKDPEGAFATALDGADFSKDGASYNAAQSAYYAAYQLYSEKQTEMSQKWSDFIGGLMSQASIEIGTLIS